MSFSSYAQWSKKFTLTGFESFQQISMPNDRIIWVLTNNRNIYLSKDGGNTWMHYEAKGFGTTDISIEWIFAFDSSTALLAANTNFTGKGPGLIYRTTNGGRNWVQVFTHTNNCDFKIGMGDKNKGLLAINASDFTGHTEQELLATLDGGITWTNKFITDPTTYYFINDFFVKGREAWLQAHDSMYYSSNLGISWTAEKIASNVGLNHMQFENKNYGIGNNSALIDIFIKRPPKKQWQDVKIPPGVSIVGAVTGLALNGNECWMSEAFDGLENFYSSDSCKTFVPVIVDSQSAFIILQKAWKGNIICGATFNKLYVYTSASNTSADEKYVTLPEENKEKKFGVLRTAVK